MESTALLVIDEQVGAFNGKLIPAIHDGNLLLERSQKLIEAARLSGVPVIFVQHCASEGLLVKGTDAWHIHPDILPKNDEHIVLKQESSAFEATDLESILANGGISTVIVCGLQSELCVSNTSISALELGLTVYIAGDAHSTWETENESAQEIILRQNQSLSDHGASVLSTDSLVSLMLR